MKNSYSFIVILILTTLLIPLCQNSLASLAQINSQINHQTDINLSQNSASNQLLEQGKIAYQQGQYKEAINLWQEVLTQSQNQSLNQAQIFNYLALAHQALGNWSDAQTLLDQSLHIIQSFEHLDDQNKGILAQNFNTQGSIYLEIGKTQEALEIWQQAQNIYQEINNQAGVFGTRLNQAQALQNLGQYRRSKIILEDLVSALDSQPDTILKAHSLRSLGVALQTVGDQEQSKLILDRSRLISSQLNDQEELSQTLFSIGNIARDVKQNEVAIEYYQEAIAKTKQPLTKIQTQLNLFSLLIDLKQWQNAQSLLPEIITNLEKLPASRQTIYGRINLAESLMKADLSQQNLINLSDLIDLLVTGINQSHHLEDQRAEAYSLNQLAKLYEERQQWQDALSLSQATLKIANAINSPDLQALAGWRLGRIYQKQNRLEDAIAAYDLAFKNIQSLRSDLVAINPDIQFDFKENVEPLYREYVGVLLQHSHYIDNKGQKTESIIPQNNLEKALKVIEALQLAELDNFFRDACLDTKPVSLDQIDTKAAVIYPIILNDRLEIIFSLPNQPLQHHTVNLNKTEVETILKQFYSSLYVGYSQDERLRLSKTIYDWLIKPTETQLEQSQVKTLVFVLDGFFRNLPMAALHDGNQYLIEKYSLALSPGLQLFPQGLPSKGISALIVGLTEARQGFNELPGVEQEVNQISQEIKGQVLLDQNFTTESFKSIIDNKSFQVVHLATHGQFSSDPEQTFLLTWNGKITIDDFEKVFEKRRFGILQPIDLLVLSACQTASGDSRATLGLAGLSLSSGAKSTLASLWSVNDQSTAKLMSEFYQQLSRSDRQLTKAEALQQAQLSLLHNPLYNHPYYWASFVLIGNWL